MDGNAWIFSSSSSLIGLAWWWLWRCEGSDKLPRNYHANIKWPIKNVSQNRLLTTSQWIDAKQIMCHGCGDGQTNVRDSVNTSHYSSSKSPALCVSSHYLSPILANSFLFEKNIFFLNLKKPKRPRAHGALLTCMRVEKESDWSRARSLISIEVSMLDAARLYWGFPWRSPREAPNKSQIVFAGFLFFSLLPCYITHKRRVIFTRADFCPQEKRRKKSAKFQIKDDVDIAKFSVHRVASPESDHTKEVKRAAIWLTSRVDIAKYFSV